MQRICVVHSMQTAGFVLLYLLHRQPKRQREGVTFSGPWLPEIMYAVVLHIAPQVVPSAQYGSLRQVAHTSFKSPEGTVPQRQLHSKQIIREPCQGQSCPRMQKPQDPLHPYGPFCQMSPRRESMTEGLEPLFMPGAAEPLPNLCQTVGACTGPQFALLNLSKYRLWMVVGLEERALEARAAHWDVACRKKLWNSCFGLLWASLS